MSDPNFSVINPSNVVEQKENKLILKSGAKLAETINFLPNGRIDKKITGIGATYLELKSKRNSIIVEPTKSIASSKAYKHNALYVGSPTKMHKRKVSRQKIQEYIKNPSIEYKKIVVVADSLPKVIDAVGEDVYNSFFFMVDEIDTFQSDATFRERLEKTIDYYFKFENRCMVSATLKDFSNPKLAKEKLSVFTYPIIPPRNINLIHTNSAIKTTAKLVARIFNTKADKMLIAYNSVENILKIIELLPEGLAKECSLMCSEHSKDIAKEYFVAFDQNFSLDKRITFMTSAFFTGIDIKVPYISITVADIQKPYTLLSEEKIYQIVGRCRVKVGVAGEYIITTSGESNKEYYKGYLKSLLSSAKNTLKALDCVKRAYRDDQLAGQLMDKVRNAVMESASFGTPLTRKDNEGNYQIAYFNIDAENEVHHVRHQLYSGENNLKQQLEKNNLIKYKNVIEQLSDKERQLIDSKTLEIKDEYNKQAVIAIENIRNNDNIDHFVKNSSGRETRVYEQYNKLLGYLEKKVIIEKLELFNIDQRDSRIFNKFYRSIIYMALVDGHAFKRELKNKFAIGDIMTNETIIDTLNKVYSRFDIGLPAIQSKITAVQELKTFFKLRKKRKESNENKIPTFEIISDSPNELTIIKTLTAKYPLKEDDVFCFNL